MPPKKGRSQSGSVKKGRNGFWGYDIRIRDPQTGRKTKRIRCFEFETKAQAEMALSIIRNADRDAKHGFKPARFEPLLADLVRKRLPEISDRAENTRATRVLRGWLDLLPAGIKIEQVFSDDIRKWVDKRTADGQSPGSIDRELNIISAALHSARDHFRTLSQWIPPKIPRPKLPKTRRERLITDLEYNQILDHLQRPRQAEERQSTYQARIRAAHLVQIALLTGMRPGEIFELKWSDLDFEGKRIKVRGTKTMHRTNSTRYLPMTPSVLQILQARQAVGESIEYVFSISGSPRYTDYELIEQACEVNGIPYGRSVENGFELYCARHTFTTRLLQEGLSLREVGAITGHSDRELVLYYSHVTPESAARATEKLEEIERKRRKNGHNLDTQ